MLHMALSSPNSLCYNSRKKVLVVSGNHESETRILPLPFLQSLRLYTISKLFHKSKLVQRLRDTTKGSISKYQTLSMSFHTCDTGVQNPSTCGFLPFYFVIF